MISLWEAWFWHFCMMPIIVKDWLSPLVLNTHNPKMLFLIWFHIYLDSFLFVWLHVPSMFFVDYFHPFVLVALFRRHFSSNFSLTFFIDFFLSFFFSLHFFLPFFSSIFFPHFLLTFFVDFLLRCFPSTFSFNVFHWRFSLDLRSFTSYFSSWLVFAWHWAY